jgi:hypothetical protein
MTPPDVPLPDWVLWIAQDADGCWWAYQAEPLQHHQGWYENEVGQRLKLADAPANPHWRDALFRVNRD